MTKKSYSEVLRELQSETKDNAEIVKSRFALAKAAHRQYSESLHMEQEADRVLKENPVGVFFHNLKEQLMAGGPVARFLGKVLYDLPPTTPETDPYAQIEQAKKDKKESLLLRFNSIQKLNSTFDVAEERFLITDPDLDEKIKDHAYGVGLAENRWYSYENHVGSVLEAAVKYEEKYGSLPPRIEEEIVKDISCVLGNSSLIRSCINPSRMLHGGDAAVYNDQVIYLIAASGNLESQFRKINKSKKNMPQQVVNPNRSLRFTREGTETKPRFTRDETGTKPEESEDNTEKVLERIPSWELPKRPPEKKKQPKEHELGR